MGSERSGAAAGLLSEAGGFVAAVDVGCGGWLCGAATDSVVAVVGTVVVDVTD